MTLDWQRTQESGAEALPPARLWLAINTGYADGGSTVVNGLPLSTLQGNTRSGLALTIPLGRQHGLMLSYSTGLTTRIGADFNSVLIGYRYMW